MNQDKRMLLLAAVEIIDMVLDMDTPEIYQRTHDRVTQTVHHARTDEYHKLQNMRKHEGKNASTDLQIELSIHCLMELDAAVAALEIDDWRGLKKHLLAATVSTVPPKRAKASVATKKKSTTGLRKRRA
ncbi:hypothetical protein PBI_HAMLET_60 [Microbacterium phage Hamlet]|uniref:Uncharacterized protein n=3 Tax=Ilzatvirus hamlet TaxID=2560591 RepID=A0A2L0HMH9_9CAUD|nr:hypothetical protein FDJ35_gp60 [Microbacterium phage Hamlet]AUX82896.1 hypothetical protein PBI_HAMLET_60 [Microbacterium phage Hamlet]AVR56146.1 hypothetical protein PBI_BEEBEE8_61 [Microbacterium phage BeeBee8]